MFDFNKLDLYKVALDDGFAIKGEFNLEKFHGAYMFCSLKDTKVISDRNWESFKTKVANYFLGVDENV